MPLFPFSHKCFNSPLIKPSSEENDVFQLNRSIDSVLSTSRSGGEPLTWDANMSRLMKALADSQPETTWPRDTLFKYYQCMEKLQENMKEYQELQMLAGFISFYALVGVMLCNDS